MYFDQNGIIHCMLDKPTYTSPLSFDSFGNIGCAGWDDSLPYGTVQTVLGGTNDFAQLAINGLGQIAFTAYVGPDIDSGEFESSEVLFDDIENGVPGPSDNLSILATTQDDQFLAAFGINNNGQIAGTFSDYTVNESQSTGFIINTDGVVLAIPLSPYDDNISGINDEVQLVGNGGESTNEGFTIDTQH